MTAPERAVGGVDCDALLATAYELVLASDALDDLYCTCYVRTRCVHVRFEVAFGQMKTVLLAARTPADEGEVKGDE